MCNGSKISDWFCPQSTWLSNVGSGRVQIAERLDSFGEIPREDVAAVLLATLEADNTIRRGFDLIAGDQPLTDAIAAL